MKSVRQEISRLEGERPGSPSAAVTDLRERYLLMLRAEGTQTEPKVRASVAGDLRRVSGRSDRWCTVTAAAAALATPTTLAALGADPTAVWLVAGVAPLFGWSLSRRTLKWSAWRRDAAAFRLDARLPARV